MKKTLLILSLMVSTLAFSQTSIDYPGNGKENFGGAVGKGSLNITETTDAISFTLTKGPGLFDSVIVFYIDGQVGGITSTAGLTGSSTDPYLAAVAGHNPSTGRAVLNFKDDFQPDAAIAFDKNGGKVFYFLPFVGAVEGSTFEITPSGTNSAPAYTQHISKSDVGLSGALNFKFLGNYIGRAASRSNEAFGDPFNSYSRTTNTSSYNSYTTTSYFTFQSSSTLPVKLVDLKAAKQQNVVSINWSVANETNIDQYEVQRSANGISFSTIAIVKAKNSAGSSTYSVNDLSAPAGLNYYRVIITERGKMEISKVISLNIDGGKIGFKANFSAPKILLLTLNNLNAGTYKLAILNNIGQVVHFQNVQVDGASQIKQLALNQNITKGIYRLTLRSSTEHYTANILVQ